MKLNLLSTISPIIGIDLGTSRTRIWSQKEGFVVDEATCVAVDRTTKKVVAAGNEAAAMEGRVSESIDIFFPIQKAEMTDSDVTQALLKVLFQKVFRTTSFFRPIAMISTPTGLSPAKRQLTSEVLYAVGAQEVYTINQSLAAAIGAGVPIADASGSFLCQLGKGRVESAIISLGSVVVADMVDQAGEYLDASLVARVKKGKNLLISHTMAEKAKQQIGTLDVQSNSNLLISGQDIAIRSPKEIMLDSEYIRPDLQTVAEIYEAMLKTLLSKVPPELTADVIDKGVLLSGGGAELGGLDMYLVESLGVPVSIVDEPEQAVIKGIATALEHLDEFKESLGYVE